MANAVVSLFHLAFPRYAYLQRVKSLRLLHDVVWLRRQPRGIGDGYQVRHSTERGGK